MITLEQRTKILALIQNCCVYEGQVLLFDHLKREEKDSACAALATHSYNLAFQNADAAGQALIAYLNDLTEADDEV